MTIRYTNRPGWRRAIYAYILKIYKLIPKITVHGNMMTPEQRNS